MTLLRSQSPAAAPETQGMAGHIASFSRALKDAGIPSHARAVVDACRAAAAVGLADRGLFYWALRANFVTNPDQFPAFDRTFRTFWEEGSALSQEQPDNERPVSEIPAVVPGEGSEGDTPSPLRPATGGASPDEILLRQDLRALMPGEEPRLREILRELLAKLAARPSRREKPSFHGRRLEFRRIFRENIRFGGEIIRLVHREKRIRRRRVVFLGDVSGSMDVYSRFFLLLAHGLSHLEKEVSLYAFATRLIPLSARGSFASAQRLIDSAVGWSGGTRIGECLKELNDLLGRRGHVQETAVVVFSDGWNRGDPALFRREMIRLRGAASRIYWLNPLKGDPGYRPLCRGMATAIPHLDGFYAAHNLESLARFAKMLAKAR